MIVITGAAGFIGSCFASFLNERGYHDLVLVDDFSRAERSQNYETKQFTVLLDRELFPAWLQKEANQVQAVIHLGARTDTTEKNHGIFQKLILEYSQRLWQVCSEAGIPFLYASSAATYGNGNQGFVDSEETLRHLQPLNPYGQAKHDFDLWVIEQKQQPPFWAGFKFFNVYGPNEYHKKRMASVIFHAFHQIRSSGKLRLFRSHNPNYADGGQMRDFVYVKDVCKVLFYFLTGRKANGIYNLGSGKARTFNDLAKAVFSALNLEPQIEYIDTPMDIRDSYQYFTEASMNKLFQTGYSDSFYTLEQGVEDYIQFYLLENKIY